MTPHVSECLECNGTGIVTRPCTQGLEEGNMQKMHITSFRPTTGHSILCECEAGKRFGAARLVRHIQQFTLARVKASGMTEDTLATRLGMIEPEFHELMNKPESWDLDEVALLLAAVGEELVLKFREIGDEANGEN